MAKETKRTWDEATKELAGKATYSVDRGITATEFEFVFRTEDFSPETVARWACESWLVNEVRKGLKKDQSFRDQLVQSGMRIDSRTWGRPVPKSMTMEELSEELKKAKFPVDSMSEEMLRLIAERDGIELVD